VIHYAEGAGVPHSNERCVFVVVESFMGVLGRTPLYAARAQGLRVAFVTRDVSRYTPGRVAGEVFGGCVDDVIEADVRDSAAVVAALDRVYGVVSCVVSIPRSIIMCRLWRRLRVCWVCRVWILPRPVFAVTSCR
uniref:hypothetical protein n=1 Tax=Streptomyces iranensis TaxID=576784 RepID=UPI0039B77CF8